ncbi:MAG: ACT domain-containing protein [Bacillota bacterium]|nr:ACT domain-containing protein [Bacillota bacterium]
MKGIVSVIGKDRLGIIADVSTTLTKQSVNIVDLSQTILDEYFTMVMLVDLETMECSFKELSDELEKCGQRLGLSVKIQHQSIFDAMHNLEYGGFNR